MGFNSQLFTDANLKPMIANKNVMEDLWVFDLSLNAFL